MDIHGYPWRSFLYSMGWPAVPKDSYTLCQIFYGFSVPIPHYSPPPPGQTCGGREGVGDSSRTPGGERKSRIVFEQMPKATPLILKLGGPGGGPWARGVWNGGRGAEVRNFCHNFGASFRDQISKCFGAGGLWRPRHMGNWRVLFLLCGGGFWKEWHSGIWEMVGRGVDSFLVLPGYPHIEEARERRVRVRG